ncbi:hypothetical protein EFD56_21235 [Rhizobium phaseoli]|uniref:hypothetical protein n=1 Tax=Rhizobium phaseoli TaxID=396 RepID=UPI000F88EE65|nr:hypothetical protein [Rhizobium phaseoli]RUM16844.1 hypothetical protein EFD56_21235 [Rhizobium phaseoli]
MSALALDRTNFGQGYVDNGTWMRPSVASLGELTGVGWRRVVADARAPVATLGSRTHVAPEIVTPTLSLKDMVADLNENGFPVSLIAELANVERKTVYNWINETVTPQQETEDRVAAVYPLLRNAFDQDYAIMRRVWRTKSREGESLQSICAEGKIDVAALEKHLKSISASIKRNAAQDGRGKPEEVGDAPAFGEHPVADFDRL